MRTLTTEALDFLKTKEGLKLTAYKCSAGKWTIGYGNRIIDPKNKEFVDDKLTFEELPLKQITEYEATNLFSNSLQRYVKIVCEEITSEINDYQFGALVSFCYNLGSFNRAQTLKKAVNKEPNNFTEIEKAFMLYTKVSGKEVKGLINRRKAEFEFYCKQNKTIPSSNLTIKKKEDMGFLSNVSNFFSKNKNTIGGAADIITDFIPMSGAVKGAVKIASKFLFNGDDGKDEKEVAEALKQADDSTKKELNIALKEGGYGQYDHEKLMAELELQKEVHDTKQAEEATHQAEIQKDIKLIEVFNNLITTGKGWYVAGTFGFYYILIILSIAYWTFIEIETKDHMQIGFSAMFNLLAFLPYKFILGGGAFDKLMNGLVDGILNILKVTDILKFKSKKKK